MSTQASQSLEHFPNPGKIDYLIEFDCPEFTCLCPKTGQPDFATIKIAYVPHKKCVELKSLKLYLWAYRNEGQFHEKVTHTILDDIYKTIQPKYIKVIGDFYVRGGIKTVITVTKGNKPKDVEATLHATKHGNI